MMPNRFFAMGFPLRPSIRLVGGEGKTGLPYLMDRTPFGCDPKQNGKYAQVIYFKISRGAV